MKKIILPLALTAIIILSCFDYSMALTIKRKSLRKTVEEMKLEVKGVAAQSALTDNALADMGADLDVLHQDLSLIKGQLEEKIFDMEQLGESVELLGQTIQALEERIKLLETPEEVTAEQEAEEKARAEVLSSLKATIKAIALRVDAIDGVGEDKATGEDPTDKYMTGLDLVREKKDYSAALIIFKEFLEENPKHDLSDNARYWVGEIHYVRGDFEKAILEFNKVIKEHPKGDKVAAAILKQGYSFERLGSLKESRMLLKKIIKKYPDSPEAVMAKEHLEKADKDKEKKKKIKKEKKTESEDKQPGLYGSVKKASAPKTAAEFR